MVKLKVHELLSDRNAGPDSELPAGTNRPGHFIQKFLPPDYSIDPTRSGSRVHLTCKWRLSVPYSLVKPDRQCFFPVAILFSGTGCVQLSVFFLSQKSRFNMSSLLSLNNFLGTGLITAIMVKEICGSTFGWLDGDAASGITWYSVSRELWGDGVK